MDEFNLDFDFQVDNMDFVGEEYDENDTLIIKPPKTKNIETVNFNYAKDLAKSVKPEKGANHFVIVSGKFVMGDFYAAFLLEHNLVADKMQIMTLSYSEYNVNVIERLFEIGKIKKLDLTTSEYFYSHSRNTIINYTYDKLRKYKNFQLAITRSHCKIGIMKTECGKHFVFHGSSNLRSCRNAEQIHIQECEKLYNFVENYNNAIVQKFKTIKRRNEDENLP